MQQLKSWLASSQDPTVISNRVKGLILTGSSVIIFIAAHVFHMTLSANDIISLATETGAVSGAIMTIYGAGLALVHKFGRV